MNIRKKLKVLALSVVMAFSFVAAPVGVGVMSAGAAPSSTESTKTCIRAGSNLDFRGISSTGCAGNQNLDDGPGGSGGVGETIKKVINFMSVLVAAIAVIMVIWGGFKYVTSGGDSNNVSSAKSTIIYALVGLVIVALAQFIVQFVLKNLL